jgi:hypothetical protein
MKEKIKEIERQWREGMPIIESDWELVFSYIKRLEKNRNKEIDTKLVMKAVSDILLTTGVYPQSSKHKNFFHHSFPSNVFYYNEGKEKTREERTPWQEGWNEAFNEISKRILEAGKFAEEGISDELALLLVADVGYLQDGKFILNMNDVFYYASDAEEVPDEDIKDVAGLFATYGYKGLNYWVSRKRGFPKDFDKKEKLEEVEEIRRAEEKIAEKPKKCG